MARQVWRAFCRHGTNLIGCRRGLGTKFLSSREIVPVDEVGKRQRCSVAVQVVSEPEICQGAEFLLRADERVRVPGCNLVPVNGTKSAKSMTNNLPLLSVLAFVYQFII